MQGENTAWLQTKTWLEYGSDAMASLLPPSLPPSQSPEYSNSAEGSFLLTGELVVTSSPRFHASGDALLSQGENPPSGDMSGEKRDERAFRSMLLPGESLTFCTNYSVATMILLRGGELKQNQLSAKRGEI